MARGRQAASAFRMIPVALLAGRKRFRSESLPPYQEMTNDEICMTKQSAKGEHRVGKCAYDVRSTTPLTRGLVWRSRSHGLISPALARNKKTLPEGNAVEKKMKPRFNFNEPR